jgi:NhaP-type Na+/H+ or K+/H+ antiporter
MHFIGLFCFLYVFKETTGNGNISDNNMLLLSSTLTASDTVAVLTLLNKTKFPKIHSIIFGEGLLNDAVAIILFNMSKKLIDSNIEMNIFSFSGLIMMLKEFIISISMSVIIGLIIGYIFLYIARRISLENEEGIIEICLIFILGFFSFYLAELVGFSGIISIFCFVALSTNYSQKFLKKETFESIDILFKSGAFLAESIAFIYLGFQSFEVFTTIGIFKVLIFSALTLFGIMIIRWISIGMPAFLFLCYDNLKVDPSELILIWYSGLIRGSVSVALIFSFHMNKTDEFLRNIVLVIALVTTVFFGSASQTVTRKLGFDQKESK